jgi:hypothetical protein
MSVVSVQPMHERRRSSYRDQKTVHYLMWLVTCDQAADGPATAITASGVPQPGTAFIDPVGNVAYLSGIDVDVRGNSMFHFECQVEFTFDPNAPDDNPLCAQSSNCFKPCFIQLRAVAALGLFL